MAGFEFVSTALCQHFQLELADWSISMLPGCLLAGELPAIAMLYRAKHLPCWRSAGHARAALPLASAGNGIIAVIRLRCGEFIWFRTPQQSEFEQRPPGRNRSQPE